MATGLGVLAPLVNENWDPSRYGNRGVPSAVVRQFIRSGLGPMLHELAMQGRITVDSQSASHLAGSNLAALAIHDRTVASLEQCLNTLNDLEIRPILLKGAYLASRYYPKAHWRAMADIDILVGRTDIEGTYRALQEAGFFKPSNKPFSAWDEHHHLAPLFHPDLKIWVEVHRGLFRHDSPFSTLPIFQTSNVLALCKPTREYGADVFYLPDELNLAYLACHWYWALMNGPGADAARGLLDAAFLLNRIESPAFMVWLTDDAAGIAVAVVLLTLIREGLIEWPEEELWRGLDSRRSPRSKTTRFLAALVRWRVVAVKSIGSRFLAQLLGDWFRALLDPNRQANILGTVGGVTASSLGGLIRHKIWGDASE